MENKIFVNGKLIELKELNKIIKEHKKNTIYFEDESELKLAKNLQSSLHRGRLLFHSRNYNITWAEGLLKLIEVLKEHDIDDAYDYKGEEVDWLSGMEEEIIKVKKYFEESDDDDSRYWRGNTWYEANLVLKEKDEI